MVSGLSHFRGQPYGHASPRGARDPRTPGPPEPPGPHGHRLWTPPERRLLTMSPELHAFALCSGGLDCGPLGCFNKGSGTERGAPVRLAVGVVWKSFHSLAGPLDTLHGMVILPVPLRQRRGRTSAGLIFDK